jgi:hypothetical protein
MIRVTIQGHSGVKGLCLNQRERKQTCGICTQGDVGPWLGFVCASCGAVVVKVEAETPEEAAAIERWMYDHMEILVKKQLEAKMRDELDAAANHEKVAAQRRGMAAALRIRELSTNFNAKRRQ